MSRRRRCARPPPVRQEPLEWGSFPRDALVAYTPTRRAAARPPRGQSRAQTFRHEPCRRATVASAFGASNRSVLDAVALNRQGRFNMHGWDAKTAEWYAEKYGEYATNRLAVDSLDDLRPASVLDVGCGTGAALRHASARWPSARFVGVDPVPRMVEIARERLAGHAHEDTIEFSVGTAEALPVEDSSVDLVFAFDSLDHWSDVPAGAREVARVLAAGARVVIVKDQGVPGQPDDAMSVFQEASGLGLESSQHIETEGVSFVIWVFVTDHA